MYKKSMFALVLVLVLVVSMLAGCGSQPSAPSDSADKTASGDSNDKSSSDAQKKIKIGLSIDTTNQPWRAGLVRNVTEEAEKHPEVELIVTDGQGSSNKQISDVEDLITKKVDVILISPHEGQPLTPITAEAYKSGIPVIVLDRELEGDQFTTFIGANNKTIGKQAGEFIAKYMTDNKLTKVVEIMGTPGSSPARDRSEPFTEVLAQFADIEIVAQQTANWTENEALQVTENLLQANPKGSIDLIYAHCDAMALGVIKAIKAAGRNEIKVVSIDGQKQAYEAIKNNEMVATLTYPFPGAEGVKTAIKIANGEKIGKLIEMASDLVTAENIDEFYNPDSPF
jgi:ABC-type sugar transport system substrate-binding protein